MKAVLLIPLLILLIGCAPSNILDVNLKEHKNLDMHIHPVVEIEVLGKQQFITEGVGITNNGMRVIHTHDATGKLHVESPRPYLFHLQDFFTIWERRYTEECIFDNCVDETHSLKVYVNGEESERNPPLYDNDKIKIEYEEI